MSAEILVGDCRESLRSLPERSVQTCVTSPPYFGLRDYGTGEWDGGSTDCDHVERVAGGTAASGLAGWGNSLTAEQIAEKVEARTVPARGVCRRCGARRVDRQIGLEPTPDEFVAALVDVFREVRRVLRDDGTVWLNLGDSYAGSGATAGTDVQGHNGDAGSRASWAKGAGRGIGDKRHHPPAGLKPKDLIGIPWLVAFALRADGWWLRSEIIWAKPNPMPESVADRPTRAHEQVFLLSKSRSYFYDADAIREAHETADRAGDRRSYKPGSASSMNGGEHQTMTGSFAGLPLNEAGRNKRSVWTVATQPYAGAHFATFPPKLIEPCILAGSPPKCCGVCGAAWERVTECELVEKDRQSGKGWLASTEGIVLGRATEPTVGRNTTVGWRSACEHDDDTGRSVVLDPFAGAGTVGVVCDWHGRDFIGCELNPAYAQMARERIASDGRLGRRAYSPPPLPDDHVPLFDLESLA